MDKVFAIVDRVEQVIRIVTTLAVGLAACRLAQLIGVALQ